MSRGFEFFVALRYLTARRKQAVISIITLISVLGVAAGVMALLIASAVTTGFRKTLERNLLGATAHVWILEKQISEGISGYRDLSARLSKMPGVKSATPALYGQVMFLGNQAAGGTLKGILPPEQAAAPLVLRHLKQGEFKDWNQVGGLPPILMGSRLAAQTGATLGAVIRVMSPQGEMTAFGPRTAEFRFRVAGIFESGFFDVDNMWSFTSLSAAQKVLGLETRDVANTIELEIADVNNAPEVARAAEAVAGPKFAATHWMEQNRQLLSALSMERSVTFVTIFLIQLVSALNIFISLVMIVMEKHRDIAVLMSMGATRAQVSRIFILQGVTIGAAGTAIGLAAGFLICTLAERGRWIQLDEAIYSLSYVPFETRWTDAVWISIVALLVSFLATLHPARSAAAIEPAESLRFQ